MTGDEAWKVGQRTFYELIFGGNPHMMRHVRLTTLVALFVVISAVAAAAAPFAYITNSGNGSVSLIDLAGNQVLPSTIGVGASPFGVAISQDGSRVYVSNLVSGTVSVISTLTDPPSVIGTITTGGFPFGVAVNPAGTLLYVARSGNGTVGVYSTSSPYSQVGSLIPVGMVPRGVAVSPDGRYVVVGTGSGSTFAAVIDTLNGNSVDTISNGGAISGGFGVAISPDGTRAYVARQTLDIVAVIDLTTDPAGELTPLTVGDGPIGVALNADGTRLYASNSFEDSVSIIDLGGTGSTQVILVGDNPHGVSLNAAGDRLYVVNRGNAGAGTVSIVNLGTNPPSVETVSVGSLPMSLGTFIHHPSVQYALTWVRPTNGSTTGVNAGSTVPVRWSVTDANGTAISDLSVVKEITSAACASGSSIASASTRVRANSTGGSDLRYNTDHFMFNWKTDKAWAGSCRQLIVQLDDGSSHSLTFQFR